jgi:hypothetical protein
VSLPNNGGNVDLPGVTGTLTYRLKYAYGQLNFDDLGNTAMHDVAQWRDRGCGSHAADTLRRLEEGIYRYRFAGTVFADREGFLSSSDLGASMHVNFPQNYGDFHVGVYNGETYTRPRRTTRRPSRSAARCAAADVRAAEGPPADRVYDGDHYVKEREARALHRTDHLREPVGQRRRAVPQGEGPERVGVEARGRGGGLLDLGDAAHELRPRGASPVGSHRAEQRGAAAPQRLMAGTAYWFPVQKGVAAAVLLQFEQLRYMGRRPRSRPRSGGR